MTKRYELRGGRHAGSTVGGGRMVLFHREDGFLDVYLPKFSKDESGAITVWYEYAGGNMTQQEMDESAVSTASVEFSMRGKSLGRRRRWRRERDKDG